MASEKIAATAPDPNQPQGIPYIQPGTPGSFEGQQILNNQENGAFVNLVPGNNRSNQMAYQLLIEAAFKQALRRVSQIPNFSPILSRDTGGVISPDNNVLAGVNFGGATVVDAATTAYTPDMTATVVTQDGVVLIATDTLLVKDGASPAKYADALVGSVANVNLALTLDGVTVDGVALANGNRVLLKDQTLPAQNGLYLVNTSPALATRVTDLDTAGEFIFGTSVKVTSGTVNTNAIFVVSEVPTVLNTDPVGFANVTSAAGEAVIHAFDGIYTVGVVAGTAPITRTPGFDVAATVSGVVAGVTGGTLNGGKTFVELNAITTLNVDPLSLVDYATMVPTAITTPKDSGVLNSDTQVYQLP